MTTSTFRAYPPSSSSALTSSLFKPFHGHLHHRPVLYGRCHEILTSCCFHGSFGTADHTIFGRPASFECIYTEGENRLFSTVCESYGSNNRETPWDATRFQMYNKESMLVSRRYDSMEVSNRDDGARVGDCDDASESFDRQPRSLHRSFGALEGIGRGSSPKNSYHGAGSYIRDSPASHGFRVETSWNREAPTSGSHGRYVREYPVRVDRLHDVVSGNYGAHRSYRNLSSPGDANPASQRHFNREVSNSLFKNATVSVFWDLDNKPPTSSPYHAALYLRHAASQFGSVVDMVAYANHHAFTHVPNWVREQRRDRKQLDLLEQKGLAIPDKPYVCELCGRKCKTNLLLKKHFKQLHEREHNKRMSRLNALKGKKKEKYKAAMLPKTQRYKEAANPILVPKVGYGLESDLRRAGIFVKTVQYKPQAADMELKKQMADSIQKGIKCICLVSDDMDFSRMLADARALNLLTIVFGESRSLKRYADFWFSWDDICQGVPAQDFQEAIRSWMVYHDSARQRDLEILAGVGSDDSEVEHKVFGGNVSVPTAGFSAFSEEEPSMERDLYGSVSDNDTEWSFDDEDCELDDEWEDDVDYDEVI